MKKLFVLSLGGSLINPGTIDAKFVRKFKELVVTEVKLGNRFIIITGGGKPAREYQAGLRDSGKPLANDLDWMGIYATRLNAHFMRLVFGRLAHMRVVEDPNIRTDFKEKILIAGGWKPGRSTDDDAVRLAKIYGSNTIVNLSNIDYVYTKDPRKFKDAQKIETISWKDFRKIVGSKWDPGANVPFDPTAAKFAQAHKLRVIIANGKNISNLKKILSGKEFIGTQIAQ